MITEKETTRYEIDPYKMIDRSFTGAYENSTEAPVVLPPDLTVTITGCFSMLLLAGMCIMTWLTLGKWIWLAIGILCALIDVLIIQKHMKAAKTYKSANSKGAQRFDYKAEYTSLFPQDLPAKMSASEFTREIASMQNRQSKDVYNNAIRDLISKLNAVNNPSDVLCKNVNPYGTLFPQPRRRCYLKSEDGKIIVYDADFMNPAGELVIDPEDVMTYGAADNFNISAFVKAGYKISQDSVLVEIKTGSGDRDRLFLEAHDKDMEKLKKILGARKQA